ncbi:FAD-binding oxidoreductase [Rhodospirillaceae bacterium RKSG073]|nr:FAD-binding oxidoreductase [Curvivirga aplysinae]
MLGLGKRMTFQPKDITVIGAGYIGIVSALKLIKDGHKVTIIDRVGPGNGASHGNAGVLVQNNAEPISGPSTISQLPKWLFDPHGPLTIRWKHLPRLAPWLGRMILEGLPHNYQRNATALQQLTQHAIPEWNELIRNTNRQSLVRPVGWLKLFSSDASWKYGKEVVESCKKHGTKYEILNSDEIRQLEPHLAPVFKYGLLQPDSAFIIDPQQMLDQLFDEFLILGGKFEKANIQSMLPSSEKVTLFFDDSSSKIVDDILIAAGGWSNKLLKTFGESVHLQVERGYHAMVKHHSEKGPLISRPTMFCDHTFVIAPMDKGMRVTCQVELAEIDSEPDYTRLRRLLPIAKKYIPDLTMDVESEWMGARPSQPDSVPTIGWLPNHPKVMLAFGHQHLGVTMAGITGRVVSDLYAGRDPSIDLTPYRAIR